MNIDISEHESWFDNYVHLKIRMAGQDKGPLKLKFEHSKKVLENSWKIIQEETFPPDFKRCVLLAALYHDIARFDQFMRFGTFCDSACFDHGREGTRILRQSGRLGTESARDRHLVLLAVTLHNKFSLPKTLSLEQTIIAQILRDADKLDILRVLDEHLARKPYNPTVVRNLPQRDDIGAPRVREAILCGKSASYDDLRSVNDFRLLLGTWLFEMHFRGSERILLEEGHGRRIVEGLPDNKLFGEAKAVLLEKYDNQIKAAREMEHAS